MNSRLTLSFNYTESIHINVKREKLRDRGLLSKLKHIFKVITMIENIDLSLFEDVENVENVENEEKGVMKDQNNGKHFEFEFTNCPLDSKQIDEILYKHLADMYCPSDLKDATNYTHAHIVRGFSDPFYKNVLKIEMYDPRLTQLELENKILIAFMSVLEDINQKIGYPI